MNITDTFSSTKKRKKRAIKPKSKSDNVSSEDDVRAYGIDLPNIQAGYDSDIDSKRLLL